MMGHMKHKDVQPKPESKLSPAGVGAIVTVVFLFANTKRTEVNFIVYKATDIPVWWLMVVVVALTLIVERLVGIAWRRSKRKDDD
jgi:hypothetical protein